MAEQRLCYLDNNATTQVAPEVVEAMLPFYTELWGNPSSAYGFGSQVADHVRGAREKLAAMINADPSEILFTSCGTESNNSAFMSALSVQPGKRHIITSSVEHSANMAFGRLLEKRGYEVTYLPVESDGSLDICLLQEAIRPDTALVSLMWANNETGVMFTIEEAAAICRMHGVMFHSDAVQVPGKVKIDVKDLGVDMMSLSAHKLHAPKGVGLLYVKAGTKYQSYVTGGGQERGRRGGTENVASIVGFGRAAELAMATIDDENTRVRAMRDRLEKFILKQIPGTSRNGNAEKRLPNTANIAFSGLEAEALLLLLNKENICASSGSACTTGSLKPSHVLTSMGVREEIAQGSVRFSLGIYNTEEDVDLVIEKLPGMVECLRGNMPGASRETQMAEA